MKKKLKMRLRNEQGITLLALAVTIVILIILAGVTIGFALNDNGIIKGAKTAKEQTEIDNETSIVKRASTVAMIKSKYGTIDEASLKSALDDETGEGKTEVSDAGNYFEVMFIDSNRYYQVDEKGTVGEAQYFVVDEYAGDITKGGRCNGSEEKPYQISCIEDLVVFSNVVNGTGIKIENGVMVSITKVDTLTNKFVVLTKNLDFKSKYSYADSSRTDFGNINGDDTDGNSLITEMTTGTGFTPIGYPNKGFYGNFDGKGNSIENIWINIEEQYDVGLFGSIHGDATIENLTVTGEIKSNWHAGGIVGSAGSADIENNCRIINCTNRANITGYNMVGGIAANYVSNITNCKNYGTIIITGGAYQYAGAGGVLGVASINIIQDCKNYGEVIASNDDYKGSRAGIVGCCEGAKLIQILNCKNLGRSSTGIIGWARCGKIYIINCSNAGECDYGLVNKFSGANWNDTLELIIKNSYNVGKVKYSGIIGTQGTICKEITLDIENCYNFGISDTAILGIVSTNANTITTTNILNTYYDSSKSNRVGAISDGITQIDINNNFEFVNILNSNIGTNTDWNKWKLGPNGYPVFED